MTNTTNDTTPTNTISKRYTVAKFADAFPEFATENSLRFLIFQSRNNGMDDFNVVERINRRVLINCDNFFAWLEAINASTPPHKKVGA